MPTFRLFGLPLRRRPHAPPVDSAAVTRSLVECAKLAPDAMLARLGSGIEGLTNHEVNSFFQSGLRNLLDEAVLTHAELHADIRAGIGYVKIDEVPFDFERRRMSVVVGTVDGARHFLICKGAVEEVIAVCERAEHNGVGMPIKEGHEDDLRTLTRELYNDGLRVIAVAFKEFPPGPATYEAGDEAGLTL